MRRFVNKRRVVLYVSFLLISFTSCSPKLELDERVTAYQEAHNRGNVKKELSFFAEDVKFEVVGQRKMEGKALLRNFVESDATLNSHLIFTDVKVHNNKVTCKVTEKNDYYKLAGIDALNYEYREFTFENGLITEMRSQLTEESAKALQDFGTSFAEWAMENRRDKLVELRREGVISKDNVGEWLELLRAWREGMEQKEQEESEKSEKEEQ